MSEDVTVLARPEAGEVLVSIDTAGGEVAAPARVTGTWNGWAVPGFRREVADAIVRRFAESGEDDVALGDPDADGRYGIGAWEWCWALLGA